MKGLPFLSKMVYKRHKRVRVWTSGRSVLGPQSFPVFFFSLETGNNKSINQSVIEQTLQYENISKKIMYNFFSPQMEHARSLEQLVPGHP